MTNGKWGDSAGKPDPKQARAQGFEGLFLYFGTPQFSKNCTPAYYAAVRAAGLGAIGVVEHDAHDAELGAAAGASYAQAGLADMAAQGAVGIPLGVTADEHLTAGQVPTAIAFQVAASQVIRAAARQAMGYGFMEFIHALRPAGLIDIEWQAGALSLVDTLTHFWQDNNGTEQVGGVTVDRDWKRRSLPGGTMTDPLDEQITRAGTHYDGTPEVASTTIRAEAAWSDAHWDLVVGLGRDTLAAVKTSAAQLTSQGAQIAGLVSAVSALTAANAANEPITQAELTAIMDQAVAQHIQIVGTVQVLPAPAPTA